MPGRGNVRTGNSPSGMCLVGELSVRGNVHRRSVRRGSISWGSVLGEVPVVELSKWGTVRRGNALVRKCLVGEFSVGNVSGRGVVCSGECPSGKCPSGKYQSGNCPIGELSAYHILLVLSKFK